MRAGFFLIPTLIFIGNFYLYKWVVRLVHPPPRVRRAILFGILIFPALYPFSKVWGTHDFNSFNRLFTLLVSSLMGISFLLVLAAAGADMARFLLRKAGLSPRLSLSRTLYYRRLLVAIMSIGCLGVGGYAFWEARQIEVTRIEIPLRHLPPDMDGFSVVHVTDVHYGMLNENGRLSDLVQRVNELEADLVVFTGDLVDWAVSHMEEMALPLSELKGRYGVFAVMGNHEFFAGADRAEAIMKQAGIQVLRNETKVLPGGLQLLGVDDPAMARSGLPLPDFEGLITLLDPAKPSILLYHQPIRFEKVAALGVGLQMSGHVHGPQFLPMVPLVRLFYSRFQGLFQVGESYLYVSRGVGTGGPPMRLGSPPELVYIRLRSPQK